MSRNYARMTIGSGEHCEVATPPVRSFVAPTNGSTICEACHYWLPFETMSQVGQCDNPASRHFGWAEFADKRTEKCYAKRTLGDLEFMWCQSHRQTIYSTDLPEHESCRVYVSSVSLPVEDEMELTLAGD
jgi:hypothetical protein